jgi:D-amino-acid dehydrogenase
VALGAWSSDVLEPLGYRFPLGAKRGYHMHYSAKGNATLTRPVNDGEYGYVLTPMTHGIRLTTGAEFARRDDPPSSAHLDRLEPVARTLFPLAERRDPQPWLGRRPACRTCCRSLDQRRGTKAFGWTSAIIILA